MKDIFPDFDTFLGREDKQKLLRQKGAVIWMSGLSGSGKSTIANATERLLHSQGHYTIALDGDKIRAGLNSNLSFDDAGREENIRRIAEVAKLMAANGAIVFVSAITPKESFRKQTRVIIGQDDLLEIFVKASYAACEQRDVKGLYARASKGEIANFTGKQSGFEEPESSSLILDTEELTIEQAATKLHKHIKAFLEKE